METSFVKLPDEEKRRLKALVKRSDGKGLAQLAGHCFALVISGILVWNTWGTAWLVLTLPIHGVLLIFVFAPLHETIHRTAFHKRWLNDVVAMACGFVLVLPPEYFRAFHFTHHRYTQDPDRDPELAMAKPRTLGHYLWTVSGLPVWQDHISTLLKHARGKVDEAYIPERQHPTIVREARIYLTAYVAAALLSLALQSWILVILWVLPVTVGQPALRAFLLAEHTGCPLVPDMLANSRTTLSNAVVRRLAWNMPYHTAHHAYPAVPFHALDEATDLIRSRIAHLDRGYTAVHRRILTNLDTAA